MSSRKIHQFRFIAAFLAVIAIALTVGVNVANGFFGEEELYAIDESSITITPPLLVFPSEAQLAASPSVPDLPEVPEIEQPNPDSEEISHKLDARNLKVEIFSSDPEIEAAEIEECKALIEKTLAALPNELTTSLEEMKLFFSKRKLRGLSNSRLIELRCGSLNEDEIVSVLVHEIGHIVDLGSLKGTSMAPSNFMNGELKIPADDASVKFYQLSWQNETEKRALAERKDFVSGYAMTDPFEDFAESFNFYVLHGADFRAVKGESSVLAKKYDFFQNEVFAGTEFQSERNTEDEKRVWDTTLVEFNREEFFTRG